MSDQFRDLLSASFTHYTFSSSDIIGEIGQQTERGDMEWAGDILGFALSLDRRDIGIARRWMSTYGRRLQCYSIELASNPDPKREILAEEMSSASLDEMEELAKQIEHLAPRALSRKGGDGMTHVNLDRINPDAVDACLRELGDGRQACRQRKTVRCFVTKSKKK